MTAMAYDHDVDSDFVWDDEYNAKLKVLAERDELSDDFRWPPLKNAIKYLLQKTFDDWPSSSQAILHPAAALLPAQTSLITGEASTSTTSLNGAGNEQDSESSMGREMNGGRLPEEASPSTSPNTASAALALSSRFQREGEQTIDNESAIQDADLQAFFPSKRRPPIEWAGSWGSRLDSQAEVDGQRRIIFSMLDDFEGQPPFTIQRLSELVLRPTEHHHTLPKYVSALKRLLAVTATRDAFPAYAADDEEQGYVITGAGTGEAINGHATSGRRSEPGTPVPGSPSTAPLFSPIPFLMKSGDEGMPGKAELEDMSLLDEDVPGMELGGADRTSEEAVEIAKRTGAGAGSSAALTSGRLSANKEEASEALDDPTEKSGLPAIHPAPEPKILASARDVNQADLVTDAGNGPSNPWPLGVPSGRVDELDQLGEKHGQLPPVVDATGTPGGGATALSSTTTTTAREDDSADRYADATEENNRAVKRARSDRSLTTSAEKQQDEEAS